MKRVPKVQCSDAESLRQKDRVKKIQMKNNRETKSGTFLYVFFNQSHVLQGKPAEDGIFFLKMGTDV